MWLMIEVIAALYIISFAWFWSLCSLSVSDKSRSHTLERKSNLIPFERGQRLQARRAPESQQNEWPIQQCLPFAEKQN